MVERCSEPCCRLLDAARARKVPLSVLLDEIHRLDEHRAELWKVFDDRVLENERRLIAFARQNPKDGGSR